MQAMMIIRKADMTPVLECFDHELTGRIAKDGFFIVSSLQWLHGYNRAVQIAGGVQPTAEQLRAQF